MIFCLTASTLVSSRAIWKCSSSRSLSRKIFAGTASSGLSSRPSGCISNQSKTFQKSKMRKSSLFPFGSQSLCVHVAFALVPRPIICQNLIFEKTGFTKARLQTSGMSTPVSSISTEIATLGIVSCLNFFRSSWARESSDIMNRASSPLYSG